MAIQLRRGAYDGFDPAALLPGELAVVTSGDPGTQDGRAVYACVAAGDAKRVVTADSVPPQDVQDGAVTTAKIADGSVTASKLGADVQVEPADGSVTDAKLAENGVKSVAYGMNENVGNFTDTLLEDGGKIPQVGVGKAININTGATMNASNRAMVGRLYADAIVIGEVPCNVYGYTSQTETLTSCYVGKLNSGMFVTNTTVVMPDEVGAVVVVFDTEGVEDPSSVAGTIRRLSRAVFDASRLTASHLARGYRALAPVLNDTVPKRNWTKLTNVGIEYEAAMWRIGQWNASGYNGNTRRLCTYWNLVSTFGERPDALRVQILDDTELEQPIIVVGSTTNGQELYYGVTNDAVVEIPESQTNLVVSIGDFPAVNSPDYTKELIEYRTRDWANANLLVTAYFKSPRAGWYDGFTTLTYGNNTISYKYDQTLRYGLMLPDSYDRDGDPTPLILFAHGYSQEITASKWGHNDAIAMLAGFADAGYAVLDVDETSSNHYDWCNPALFDMYLAALKDVTEHYNVRLDYMYGDSMGGLNCLWLQQLLKPKACAISGLRLDFESRWPDFTGPQQTQILANFGLSEWDQDFMKQWYLTIPEYEDKDGKPASPMSFAPTLYLYGAQDSYVEDSLAKVSAMRRGGNLCKVLGYDAGHHQICYLMPTTPLEEGQPTPLQAVIDWFGTWAW